MTCYYIYYVIIINKSCCYFFTLFIVNTVIGCFSTHAPTILLLQCVLQKISALKASINFLIVFVEFYCNFYINLAKVNWYKGNNF